MFSQTADTYRYFDSSVKMMFEKPESWSNPDDIGKADALCRTARAYIAYKDPILKEGVLSCFKKEADGHYQAYRCYPDYGAEDVSRDQTITALASLLINNDVAEFKEIAPKLRYKLSKKYKQGPGMWFWTKQSYTMYGIVEFFSIFFPILWNKIIYLLLGRRKVYKEDYYMGYDPTTGLWHNWDGQGWVYTPNVADQNNGYKMYGEYAMKKDTKWLYNTLDKTEYAMYGCMLTMLMVYTMPKTFLRRVLVWLLKWNLKGDNNMLFDGMFRGGVKKSDVEVLKPMKAFRWTDRFDGSCYKEYLDDKNNVYNVIDKDILYSFIKNEDSNK